MNLPQSDVNDLAVTRTSQVSRSSPCPPSRAMSLRCWGTQRATSAATSHGAVPTLRFGRRISTGSGLHRPNHCKYTPHTKSAPAINVASRLRCAHHSAAGCVLKYRYICGMGLFCNFRYTSFGNRLRHAHQLQECYQRRCVYEPIVFVPMHT
jgi:hypothetical protein